MITINYQETLNHIHSLGNFGLPAGLDRIKSVLAKLGNPQDKLKSIHIAGTNGKGSASAMLSSVFKNAGYKTGMFISPYIIDFRERVQINGEFISETDLCYYSEKVKDTGVVLTEFEFITAVAFSYFAEQKIDILICETGLGGRFDATNTLDNLICGVITKIGLDHTAILGDTIGEIALEKCGILRGAPTITNAYQDKKAIDVIKGNAKNLIIPDLSLLKILKTDTFGNSFIYKEKKYDISLCGEFQIDNALTVIETVKASGYDIPYDILYKGLKEAFIPARMERVSDNPLIVIDGAHNSDGARVLAKEVKKFGGNVTAIIGVMKDKNYSEVLKTVLPFCKNAVAVAVENLPRSLPADELTEVANKYCHCIKADNYDNAISQALELSAGNPVFVFGSLYLAADIRKKLK